MHSCLRNESFKSKQQFQLSADYNHSAVKESTMGDVIALKEIYLRI